MGEIIKRVSSDADLEFTGERFTGEATGQTAIEHIHRALMARSLCAGKDVLDIASGEGYCSAFISQVARNVVGVDIDPVAVEHANICYGGENLRYICGSALNIPLDDASVDIVVSFETIEHFREHSQFLKEVRRVLRPGGVAIISTPDLAIYSVDGQPANPYHVQEMTRDEFGALMDGFFQNVVYLGQRTLVGSALIADNALTKRNVDAPFLTYEARGWNAFERSSGLSRARYLIALASDDPKAIALVEQSVFVSTSEIDQAVGMHDDLKRDLSRAQIQIAEHGTSENRWRSDIETITSWHKAAQHEVESLNNYLEAAAREIETTNALALSLSADLQAKSTDLNAVSIELSDVRQQLEAAVQVIAEIKRARDDQQVIATNLRTEVEHRDRERERLTSNFSVEIDGVSQQLNDVRVELTDARAMLRDRDTDASLLGRILTGSAVDISSFQSIVRQARNAAREGDYNCAEGLFRTAASARPTDGEAWRSYANVLHKQGAYCSALGAWERALSVSEHDAAALAGAGFTLAELGQHDAAVGRWKAALAVDPLQPGLYERLKAEGLKASQLIDIVLTSSAVRSATHGSRTQSYLERLPTALKARSAARNGRPRRAARLYRRLANGTSKVSDLISYADTVADLIGLAHARDLYFRAYSMASDDSLVRRRIVDLRWEDFGFRLQPKVDLRVGSDGAYQTLSDDPQFDLDPDGRQLPSGWTLISISGDTRGEAIRPVLYAFYGELGEQVKAFTFPVINGRATVRCLVPLPEGVKRLRLDPVGKTHVTFHLNRVGWITGSALQGSAFEPITTGFAFVGEVEGSHGPSITISTPASLRPIHDIEILPDGVCHSIGNDPQFEIVTDTPVAGWTWIDIQCPELDAPLDPMLYAFSEGEVISIALPPIRNAGGFQILVRLPDHVKQLRFDPTTRINALFSIPTLRICSPAPTVNVVLAPCSDAGWNKPAPSVPRGTVTVACEVSADAHLEAIDGGLFQSTGDDPQFSLKAAAPLPDGLVRMTLRIAHLSQPIDATLYAFPETDAAPFTYALRSLDSGRIYEFKIVLPKALKSLRFDPCDQPGITLALPEITLTALPTNDGATFELAEGERLQDPLRAIGTAAILHPLKDLRANSEEYLSTGDDPQFGITFGGKSFPIGWTIVTLAVPSADAAIKPTLYCWAGDTVTQISLPSTSNDAASQYLVHFPADLTAMRLDPTDMVNVRFSRPTLSFAPAEAFGGHLLRQVGTSKPRLEYQDWCDAYDRLTPQDVALIADAVTRLRNKPLISVVMPVYDPEPRFLRRALDSVVDQLYPHWELCVAEDCSPNPEIRAILQEYAERDERIKVTYLAENGHISRASNAALQLVSGPFVALMDHDDELPAHALYLVAHEVNRFPEADIIYSDEDKIDAHGRRHDPHFKTDWNRELFYSQNMIAHLGVYRTSLIREVGGFRPGLEGSQDYDFALRILRLTTDDRIRHIPHVLYHWRIFEGVRTFSSNNPDRSIATARRAMDDYFLEVEPSSVVTPLEAFPSWWRIQRQLPKEAPSVTIVIPTRDHIELLRNCVEGVLERTHYQNVDIVIVDNGSVELESLTYFTEITANPRVTVIRDDGAFNYARLNNAAVAQARGTYVCFLNNDIEVIEADWLGELVSQALQPGVGAVGTRLLYESGNIQHAGVTIGTYGVAAHGHRHFPGESIGYFGHPQLVREVSAVTAAALLMPKALFQSLGGFDQAHLAVSYNDVDLCLRIREAGYTIVYTPFAALYHLESASRGPDVTPEKKELQRIERGYMKARWGHLLGSDPYYSPNLSLDTEDYALAFPPRASRPWIQEADVAERLSRAACAALPKATDAAVAALATATTIVVACSRPFEILSALAKDFGAGPILPREIILVDNSARNESFVRDGVVAAFRESHSDVALRVIDDPSQDFNASRTANIGFGATDATTPFVLLIAEDCALTSGWFEGMLRSWLAADDAETVVSPALFVRENLPSHGLLMDGYIDIPPALIASSPSAVLSMGEDYETFPIGSRREAGAVMSGPAIASTALLYSGVLMARRETFAVTAVDGNAQIFDPLLYTTTAQLEDFTHRSREHGSRGSVTFASLAVLSSPRPRDRQHLWQYWHDYLWLNRKVHGVDDDGVIEFVCPFHRGDVLIGLQVAYTAYLKGRQIRFHVADSLLDWVKEFNPPFPVRGLPVPVPAAHETAFYLLRSYEYLVRQSGSGPKLVRSHPERGLDAMDNNLTTAMAKAVGLSADTPIESLLPTISPAHRATAAKLLEPYGDAIILLHRSGGWGLKSLPDAVLGQFAATVKTKGLRLVQIGGPADEKSPQADGMIRGNFEIGVWAAMFERAKAVAGIDSWSAHMAAILDVPQITFYGSTHPRHVASKPFFRKQEAKSLLIAPTVACSPCNSLTCLYQSEPYCLGFSADPILVSAFLDDICQ